MFGRIEIEWGAMLETINMADLSNGRNHGDIALHGYKFSNC